MEPRVLRSLVAALPARELSMLYPRIFPGIALFHHVSPATLYYFMFLVQDLN